MHDETMCGTMMDFDLTVGSILRHANRFHGARQIVTRTSSGDIHRYTYRDLYHRCRRLSQALAKLGAVQGDRIATLAWNNYRHLEVYFAAPSMGAIVHTVNPRLFPEQLEFIVNHASDRFLLVEPDLVPLIEQIRGSLKSVEHFIVLDSNSPDGDRYLSYESLIDNASDDFVWPAVNEQTGATLCYTSGTTGDPKGVLYSHRSTVLHTLAVSGADWFAVRKRDAVLPVVPMYHVNAWSLPYASTMNGAKLVLPGVALDSNSLHELIVGEDVTVSAGVPTIWTDMITHLEDAQVALGSLERIIVGGTAPTPFLIKSYSQDRSIDVLHGWGMTETSSLGLLNTPDEHWDEKGPEERQTFMSRQGRPPYPVDVRVLTETGAEAAWDGATLGQLFVRGPTVADHYFNSDKQHPGSGGDGWFATGDIVRIDSQGYVEIVDRDKDLIKSGGEWISSIALENIASSHPEVLEAAVIGVPHPRWDERPILVFVPRQGTNPAPTDILRHYKGKVAKWWIPDDAVMIESLPKQATGKVWKAKLREKFAKHTFSNTASPMNE